MTKRITQTQQIEAYDHGYRSCELRGNGLRETYTNPYDSDKYWLLFLAFEQGWNDRASWEREQAKPKGKCEPLEDFINAPFEKARREKAERYAEALSKAQANIRAVLMGETKPN